MGWELIKLMKVDAWWKLSTLIIIGQFHEKLLMWWKSISVMKSDHCDKNLSKWESSLKMMKIPCSNEKSLLMIWGFIKVMKTSLS